MEDFYTAKRHQLEELLAKAALDLLGFTNAAGAKIPIPGTTPPLFIVVGDAAELARLIED